MTDERVERAFQGHERIDREALARYREKPWGHDMAPINLTTLRRLIGTIDALEEIASMSTPDGELEGRAREILGAEYRAADLPYIFDLAVPNERDRVALRAIAKALSLPSTVREEEWRDIESAPKDTAHDGLKVDVWLIPHPERAKLFTNGDKWQPRRLTNAWHVEREDYTGWRNSGSFNGRELNWIATHWRPLPDPPGSEPSQGGCDRERVIEAAHRIRRAWFGVSLPEGAPSFEDMARVSLTPPPSMGVEPAETCPECPNPPHAGPCIYDQEAR